MKSSSRNVFAQDRACHHRSAKETGGRRRFGYTGALLLAAVLGCAPAIAPFSQAAYEQAVTLKVESLALIGKATEPYDRHAAAVETLLIKVERAYEYARGRPKNEISARQWEILKDPERNLLGGFLMRWCSEGRLGAAFVREAKALVAQAFDQIIGLALKRKGLALARLDRFRNDLLGLVVRAAVGIFPGAG